MLNNMERYRVVVTERQLAINALYQKLENLTLTAMDRAVLIMELEKLINE